MLRTIEEEACRTISAVQGTLARFSYLASLQVQPGEYHHWGLSKEYGQPSVSRAFGHSHQLLMNTLLQTDIAEILGELLIQAQDQARNPSECLERLLSWRFLRPRESAKQTEIHFNY